MRKLFGGEVAMKMLSPKRRELMLRVADGDQRSFVYLFHLNSMRRCEDILEWLIHHRYTGRSFVDYVAVAHEGSVLSMARTVVMWLEKNEELRPILIGQDFVSPQN